MRNPMQWFLILTILLASAACAAPAVTPTPTPRPPSSQRPLPTSTPVPPPARPSPTRPLTAAPRWTPTPSGRALVAQAAKLGGAVYAHLCARCHGDQGQGLSGPALLGAGTNIQRHGDALGLLGYFSSRMPPGAPGSLSEEQYSQILAWILLENGFVEPSAVWAELGLSDISLAK